jgi:hypothetical protein
LGTHVTIDDDVVRAAEKLAQEQDRSLGEVISELARSALSQTEIVYRNGIPQLPARPGVIVTLELVNELRDEAP